MDYMDEVKVNEEQQRLPEVLMLILKIRKMVKKISNFIIRKEPAREQITSDLKARVI